MIMQNTCKSHDPSYEWNGLKGHWHKGYVPCSSVVMLMYVRHPIVPFRWNDEPSLLFCAAHRSPETWCRPPSPPWCVLIQSNGTRWRVRRAPLRHDIWGRDEADRIPRGPTASEPNEWHLKKRRKHLSLLVLSFFFFLIPSKHGSASVGGASRQPGLLPPQHHHVFIPRSHLAAQVQAEVAEDGPAGRPHCGPDHRTAGTGLCWGGWSSCAGVCVCLSLCF